MTWFKLTIFIDRRLASEGHRPSFLTSTPPAPQIIISSNDSDIRLKRQAISAEEQWARKNLLGTKSTIVIKESNAFATLGTDAELRRRLGLTGSDSSKSTETELDLSKQLERDRKTRDDIANDVLGLINTLKENSLNVQKSLQSDTSRIEVVDQMMNKNLENVQKEITRVDTLFKSTSASCRANCTLVFTVLAIWIAVYLVMKVTPRPVM